MTAGTTQTTTNLTLNSSAGNVLTIDSLTAGVAATISVATGDLEYDYLSLKDSTAAGGATFYAGSHSTDVSGNSGWLFQDAPGDAALPKANVGHVFMFPGFFGVQ